MILVTHLIVGAAVGSQINNPAAGFSINLLLHYLLDSIPHWDYLDKILKKDIPKIAVDFLVGVMLLVPLYFIFSDVINPTMFLLGAAAGILPDILQGLYNLFGLKFLNFHHRFHHFIHFQKNQPFLKGFGIQLILAVAGLLFMAL